VIKLAINYTAPSSTTYLARLSECLEISLKHPAAILFNLISGS